MKKNIFSAIFMALLVLATSVLVTSCKEDELDTNQYTGEMTLLAFGPSPVARGGQLTLVGNGLDQVKTIILPNDIAITDFTVVSPEKITLTVPQAAQPGYIKIKSDSKESVSKTRLTYTEPVGYAAEGALTPNPIKPGQTLTIKGTYLNLVQKVIFADKVEVLVPNAEPTKIIEEISVVVPEEAKTGKVIIAFCATGDTIFNEIQSAEVLEVIQPSVKKYVELKESKPGDVVSVLGQDFDLVKAVLSPAGDSLAYEVNSDYTEISFALPANVGNGVISLVAASGVKVPAVLIGMALPKELALDKAEELRAEDIITISGKDLELVTSVEFPTMAAPVAGKIQAGRTATEIKVAMPKEAVSGSIVLTTAAGISVNAETEKGLAYETLKPLFKNFGAAESSLGSEVKIYGKYFDLVVKVGFTGGSLVEGFEPNANVLAIKMPPVNSETGVLTLYMENGETVETPELTITEPEFCYITKWPDLPDGEPLQAGSVLIVTTENAEHLVKVLANGNETQFMVNENLVYILTPYNGKPGTVFTLVSDNGEIEYTYDLKPNTEIETVIWAGMETVEGWKGSLSALSWGGYDWSTVAEGLELRIYYQLHPAAEYDPVMRAGNGSWAALPTWKTLPGADGDGNVPIDGSEKYMSITLTQADLEQLVDKGGLVVCGAWFIVTKVTLVEHISLEETLWKGEAVADDWGNQPAFFEDGGADLLAAGLKVGSIIRFYITPTDAAWNAQVTEGHWGPKWNDLSQDSYDLAANNGAIVLEVTQEIYDAIITPQNWGNAFLINGDNVIVTKITIE